MSFSDDVKAYTDAALEQGMRAIDQAQAVLAEMTGDATELAARLQERGELVFVSVRAGDPKGLINIARGDLELFLSTVEPYVAQALSLRAALIEKTAEFVGDVRKDPRVAKAYETAESLTGAVVETMNERVVAPTMSMMGRQPAASAAKAPAKAAATAKAAPMKAPAAKKAAAKKAPARKAAAKKSTAAKKAPAKKSTTV